MKKRTAQMIGHTLRHGWLLKDILEIKVGKSGAFSPNNERCEMWDF